MPVSSVQSYARWPRNNDYQNRTGRLAIILSVVNRFMSVWIRTSISMLFIVFVIGNKPIISFDRIIFISPSNIGQRWISVKPIWKILRTRSYTDQFKRTGDFQSWSHLGDHSRVVPWTKPIDSWNSARSCCAISTWSTRWFLSLLQTIVVRWSCQCVTAFETGK
jgi:hypothetical protein